ncbi:MAG: SBBP repeat-containing protein, partial [Ferruginibacter sp.]
MRYLITIFFLLLQNILFAQSLQWAKGMGGTGDDRGHSIATDALGNVFTTGEFEGTADFDPGPAVYNLTANGLRDIFVSKLDAAGNFLWAKAMGASDFDVGKSLVLDVGGNVYVTGSFSGTVDFDPGPGVFNLLSPNSNNIFILKLDAAGNFVWVKELGGPNGSDLGYAIAIDAAGNLYSTGRFLWTADFDPGPGTYNLTATNTFYADVYISKLDPAGNFLWAKQLGGNDDDWGYAITVDATGNIYTTGFYSNTADFDPGPGVFNLTATPGVFGAGADIFISKLDAAGNFVWAKTIGGADAEYGYGIKTDASGNVYTTGQFTGTIDIDPGPGSSILTGPGFGYGYFVLKLDPTGNFLWGKMLAGAGNGVTTDLSGNVYTVGYSGMTKLDPAGNILSAVTESSLGQGISVDAAGYIYRTGVYYSVTDFDPT